MHIVYNLFVINVSPPSIFLTSSGNFPAHGFTMRLDWLSSVTLSIEIIVKHQNSPEIHSREYPNKNTLIKLPLVTFSTVRTNIHIFISITCKDCKVPTSLYKPPPCPFTDKLPFTDTSDDCIVEVGGKYLIKRRNETWIDPLDPCKIHKCELGLDGFPTENQFRESCYLTCSNVSTFVPPQVMTWITLNCFITK